MKRLIQKGRQALRRLGSNEAPATKPESAALAADTISVVLKNTKASGKLFAHITGSDSNGLFILSADGKTPYRPKSPSKELQPLERDSAIVVGTPGQSRTVTVPRISGARIWFSRNAPLEFFLNPGPALVEPSAMNTKDANYKKDWGFCEFTYNQAELYVNVSYVDFVSLPIALQLENQSGNVRRVDGMPADGLQKVAAGLVAQGKKDGKGWEKLVIRGGDGGHVLRALSPNAAGVLFPELFKGYYQGHVDAVWDKYRGEDLTVNTQYDWGDVKGRVGGDGKLTFKGDANLGFAKPSAQDIFSCSTGPFAGGEGVSPERLNIGARLAAALNRSTLLANNRQPEGEKAETYYKEAVTNHYARVCHETTVKSRGYAFPYDDVGPSKGEDQSGFLNDPKPKVLTVEVGGKA
jgi:hypothetical protein